MSFVNSYRFSDGCNYSGGLYTKSEIDDLVNIDGYIPVANATEFDNIRTGASETMGLGSCWEGTYTTGTDKKYVQVANIDFTGFGTWSTLLDMTTGLYDSNELIIGNVTQSVSLFRIGVTATLRNVRLQDSSCTSATNAIGLATTIAGATIENCRTVNYTITAGSTFSAVVFTGQATYTDNLLNADLSGGLNSGHYGTGGGDFLRCKSTGTVTALSTNNQIGGWMGYSNGKFHIYGM